MFDLKEKSNVNAALKEFVLIVLNLFIFQLVNCNYFFRNTEWRTKKETEILMAHNLRNIIGRKIIFT